MYGFIWSGMDMPQDEATSRLRRYDAIQGARTAGKPVSKELIRENDIIDLQSISTIIYYVKTLCKSTPGATLSMSMSKATSSTSTPKATLFTSILKETLSMSTPKATIQGRTDGFFKLNTIDLYAYILSFLVPKGKLNGEAVDIFKLMNINFQSSDSVGDTNTTQAGSSKKKRARANVSGSSTKKRASDMSGSSKQRGNK